MGVNNQQNDYYESLFRRTTASYRAKCDRENSKTTPAKKRSLNTEPSSNRRQAPAENRKVLRERNNGETSSASYDLVNSVRSAKSSDENQVDESNSNRRSIKLLTERLLAQVLCEKYSQEFVDNDQQNSSEEKSPIKCMIEQILKEKLKALRQPLKHKHSLSFSDPSSLKSIIEDVVTQVLHERFINIQNKNDKPKSSFERIRNLNQELEQKLTISTSNEDSVLPRGCVTHDNNKPLDTQSLVQELLGSEKLENKIIQKKNLKQSKADKDNSKNLQKACGIKRLQRSPKKRPEWQDPSVHDKILDKATRAQSPVASSSAYSGRSSSVLSKCSLFLYACINIYANRQTYICTYINTHLCIASNFKLV